MKRLTISDLPEKDYAKALDDADSLAKLRAVLKDYEPLTGDALDLVNGWSESDYTDWRKALQMERHGRFMGDADAARFMAVLLPEVMFRISAISHQFGVPFVIARDRLLEERLLYRRGGRLVVNTKLKNGASS